MLGGLFALIMVCCRLSCYLCVVGLLLLDLFDWCRVGFMLFCFMLVLFNCGLFVLF